jgi:hypothetical protein
MIETSDQAEQAATGPSPFAAWRADIDRLAAEAGRVVGELTDRLGRPPELTGETITGLLRLRERLGIPAYNLPADEWPADCATVLFPQLGDLWPVKSAVNKLLADLDRTLGILARQRHEGLLLVEDFGAVDVIDVPGSRPFVLAPVARLPAGHCGHGLLTAEELYAGCRLVLGPAKAVGVAAAHRSAFAGVPLRDVPVFVPRVWAPYDWYGSARSVELTREMEAKRRAEEEDRRRTNEILQEQAERRRRAEEAADPAKRMAALERRLRELEGRAGEAGLPSPA